MYKAAADDDDDDDDLLLDPARLLIKAKARESGCGEWLCGVVCWYEWVEYYHDVSAKRNRVV
jgi:hypothetical protein